MPGGLVFHQAHTYAKLKGLIRVFYIYFYTFAVFVISKPEEMADIELAGAKAATMFHPLTFTCAPEKQEIACRLQ